MKTWKNFFPLMRCPACRRWLVLRGRSEYSMRLATKKQISEVKGDDDSITPPERLSNARTREGASDDHR